MTLRIHFTAEDLARTRLASGVRPLLELDIGIRLLQERSHPVRFDAWRRRAAPRLQPQLAPLFDLIPALGPSADFLDLSRPESPDDFRERLSSTPTRRVAEDLERWVSGLQHVPRAARQLRQDTSLVPHLAQAVHTAHEMLVAPYWPRIEQLASADRTLRLRQLAEHGVERLLSELNPRYITWSSPVLHLTTASNRDGDIHLAGRGLLLVPTVFGAHYPAYDHPDDGQPWITFPVRDSAHATTAPAVVTAGTLSNAPSSLRALLGRTRATVLWVIAEHTGCTTTQLATHAGISPASASEHASVLRKAGLTSLTRDGKTARHAISPSGRILLNSAGV
ncbi:transcriptional regulator [Streptomyces viridosporus ATCC 14672]|uniref:Transcriptional regulator n=1 Tax=Streptomyces viridosporus (strain ATCC 14672 / DSM 40746 / JCM 4963 / KCTC 9882 / NRRL B-12104 / FH 1290) TaxID=566461 RepID=D6AA52_STRV1|nr:winged helix-turn-helix domain-containing protein [Streptomyces viridosporus]EFE72147.1 transcriptional regulator [Streptomyces viridosporus ATCC 14672]